MKTPIWNYCKNKPETPTLGQEYEHLVYSSLRVGYQRFLGPELFEEHINGLLQDERELFLFDSNHLTVVQ